MGVIKLNKYEVNPPWTIQRRGRNVFRIQVNGFGPQKHFRVLLRSDAHHDNPKCNQELERYHLELAKAYNAPIIDNGDLFCAMQGKYDRRSNKDSIRPENQTGDYLDSLVQTAGDFYAPYAKQFAVLGHGNHETSIKERHETDLTQRLAERLKLHGSPVLTSGYGGWVRVVFVMHKTQQESYILHHYHGSGGGGPVTKGVIQTNRMATYTTDADVVLTGHFHESWGMTVTRQRLSSKDHVYHHRQEYVSASGYKDAWGDGYGGFEVERRHGPKPVGAAWWHFWYDDKRCQLSSDGKTHNYVINHEILPCK